MAVRLKTDRVLFYTVLIIVMFGIVILYSASSVMAETKMHLSEWHFVTRQFIWMVIGVAAMLFFKNMHYRRLQSPGVAFSAIGLMIVLLMIVFLLDPAHHRWLRLGPLGVQPSELAKPALVIFL